MQGMLPETNRMPDLAHLTPLVPPLVTAVLAFGGPNLTTRERLYARLLARLANKAISEYRISREALAILIDTTHANRLPAMISFIDHMENCLNAVARLFHVLDAAKREQNGGLCIDRATRRALESSSTDVSGLRNAIEHMEEEIRTGEKGPVNVWFTPDGSGIELASHSVSFDGLCRVLKRFHTTALRWLDDFCGAPA